MSRFYDKGTVYLLFYDVVSFLVFLYNEFTRETPFIDSFFKFFL